MENKIETLLKEIEIYLEPGHTSIERNLLSVCRELVRGINKIRDFKLTPFVVTEEMEQTLARASEILEGE